MKAVLQVTVDVELTNGKPIHQTQRTNVGLVAEQVVREELVHAMNRGFVYPTILSVFVDNVELQEVIDGE